MGAAVAAAKKLFIHIGRFQSPELLHRLGTFGRVVCLQPHLYSIDTAEPSRQIFDSLRMLLPDTPLTVINAEQWHTNAEECVE
jgi:hypothetical protein